VKRTGPSSVSITTSVDSTDFTDPSARRSPGRYAVSVPVGNRRGRSPSAPRRLPPVELHDRQFLGQRGQGPALRAGPGHRANASPSRACAPGYAGPPRSAREPHRFQHHRPEVEHRYSRPTGSPAPGSPPGRGGQARLHVGHHREQLTHLERFRRKPRGGSAPEGESWEVTRDVDTRRTGPSRPRRPGPRLLDREERLVDGDVREVEADCGPSRPRHQESARAHRGAARGRRRRSPPRRSRRVTGPCRGPSGSVPDTTVRAPSRHPAPRRPARRGFRGSGSSASVPATGLRPLTSKRWHAPWRATRTRLPEKPRSKRVARARTGPRHGLPRTRNSSAGWRSSTPPDDRGRWPRARTGRARVAAGTAQLGHHVGLRESKRLSA